MFAGSSDGLGFEKPFDRRPFPITDVTGIPHLFILLVATGSYTLGWFNMDFGQFGWLRHHQLQKGFEQAFTPDPDVVHELKEAQVERQFFL